MYTVKASKGAENGGGGGGNKDLKYERNERRKVDLKWEHNNEG
jgi:hypothetical protein